MKKALPRIFVGLLCLAVLLGNALGSWQIPFVKLLENYFYDVRIRLLMSETIDDRIVVVDIDEKSLNEIGHWPWGRNRLATLMNRLFDDYKVAVIGFDVVFAERDDSSGLKSLEEIGRKELRNDSGFQASLQKFRHSLDYDRMFIDSISGRPSVLGYYFNQNDAQRTGTLPPPVFSAETFAAHPEQFLSWQGFGGNLPEFQQAAASGGHFNPQIDADGNVRRVPLIVEHQGQYFEALSIAMIRTMLGSAELQPGFPEPGLPIEWLDIVTPQGALRIPVDENAAALVPFRGPERSFRYVSASDILMDRVEAESLAGRIVIVGSTAPGLNDLRSTPVGSNYPGVEVHANMIAGILDGEVKEKPGYLLAANLLAILFFGGLLAIALPLLSPLWGTLLTAATLLVSAGSNLYLWQAGNIVMPYAGIFLAIGLIYAFNMASGFFTESRTKRQFSALFGQYVPPELVDEMARNPENYSMEGRNAELTVLFSDVRSFTTISEGMDPKELAHLMNEYLGSMTDVIRQHRGTLDKYIGDAIMAFWGAPVANPNHAREAVLTAIAMQERLKTLAEPFRARGWPVLHIGIGVNTGTMTVGDMGSEVRKSYTVMGDAVNLGARLEGITKEYGVGIVVGELTRAATPEIAYRELDLVRVKGKAEPIAIFEPLGSNEGLPEATRREVASWHEALALYRAQYWDQAEALIGGLAGEHPECSLYRLYLERIALLRDNPPTADWDGVTTFKTK